MPAVSTSSFTSTLTNQSSALVSTPEVSLSTQVFGTRAFLLNTSGLPTTIPVSSSASFTVTFAPGQTGLASATLLIGTNSYPLVGTGIVVGTIDALQVSYVDQTGVRGLPQAATPIDFGQTRLLVRAAQADVRGAAADRRAAGDGEDGLDHPAPLVGHALPALQADVADAGPFFGVEQLGENVREVGALGEEREVAGGGHGSRGARAGKRPQLDFPPYLITLRIPALGRSHISTLATQHSHRIVHGRRHDPSIRDAHL